VRRADGILRHRERGAYLLAGWLLLAPIAGTETATGAAASSVLLGQHRTEPDVAVDPRDPRVIAVATNPTYQPNAEHQEPIGVFLSHDGGRTWAAHDAPLVPPFVTGSDPSVAFTPDGTLFVGFEAVSAGFCGSASRTAVLVTRSNDAGDTFATPTILDVDPDNDKPFLAAGPGPGGKGDAVYVSWIRFISDSASQVAFSRSLDGGRSFSAPVLLSSGPGIHIAPMPATDGAGRVYVAWLAGQALPGTSPSPARQHVEVRASADAGARFGPVGRTPSFWGLPGLEQPGSLRLFNGPSLAVAGPHRLYLAWAQAHPAPGGGSGTGRADVVLSRSSDGGLHWSAPFALNDTARGDRFEPRLAAGPGGLLAAVFYDRRRTSDLDLEMAVVRDLGSRVLISPNQRLTARPSPISAIPFIPPGNPCLAQGRFFGDYIGAAVGGGRAMVAWTGSSLAQPGSTAVRFLDVPIAPPP
jgi:hypothetical protein